MTRTLSTLALLTTLSACAVGEHPGSQIGSEEDFSCTLLSSEVLTDLSAVPDGMSLSPQAAIDGAVGTWQGAALDDQEQPTSGSVTLTVTHAGGAVTLERFEATLDPSSPESGTVDSAAHCPARYSSDLVFTLAADGLPAFEATIETTLRDEAWAETADPAAFASALPAPSFDPDDFEEVEARVVFSGGVQTDWWAYVDWRGWNPSEAGFDGDVPVTSDLLLSARLTRN